MIDFVYYFKKIFELLSTLANNCIDFLNTEINFLNIITIDGWGLVGSGFVVLMVAKLIKKVVPMT